MKFSLAEKEEKKLLALFAQHEKNVDYFIYLSRVLTDNPQLLDEKAQAKCKDKNDFEKKNLAFNQLEKLYKYDNDFVKDNIRWDTVLLAAEDFKANPYLKAINDLTFKEEGWALSRINRKAYTLCPYQEEYAYGANYSIKMSLMMFKSDYIYPSISLYDTEWMSLNQHEIRTMEIPIQLARGKVLTLGLGLGYYAYMVSLKEEVKEVHIVEMDLELIKLFTKYLLPLFPHREKIHIHKADAFHFITTIRDRDYDFIFADLWHDVSDGLPMYIKLKETLNSFKQTQCHYWIEGSLVTYLRTLVIGIMKDEYYQNDNDYNEFQLSIKNKLLKHTIKDSSDVDSLLSLKGLNQLLFGK